MPLMAVPKKVEKEAPFWVVGIVMVLIFLFGLAILTGAGYLIYYAADLICVGADPGNASALCQDIRD